MKTWSLPQGIRRLARPEGPRTLVAVSALLAVGAVVFAIAGLRSPMGSGEAVNAGAAAAAALSIAGMLMAGAGTAGVLLLRAYGWLRGLGGSNLSPGKHGWVAGRSLAESVALGLAAVLPGLFLLAFVQLVAEDNHQGVMFPVLNNSVVLDGRALVLAFVVVTGLGLICGLRPVLDAARSSLGPTIGMAWRNSLRRVGVMRLVAVIVPVAVSCALVAGTTMGVRRVVSMVWLEQEVDRGSAVVLDVTRGNPSAVPTNVPPAVSLRVPLLHS